MSTHTPALVLRPIAALALAVALASCSGGNRSVPYPASHPRPLPADYRTRKAVAYGPYRSDNESTETVTEAEISQDLNLLAQGNFGLIRLYSSSDMVAKQTLEVIKANNLDIKVHLGCWIASEENVAANQVTAIESSNQAEIARCIALANSYPDLVEVVSVGNECMVSWSGNPVAPSQMASYIHQVRSAIAQPVTTDDNYAYFTSATANILGGIDFVSLHSYALTDSMYPNEWDWHQASVPASGRAAAMMAQSIAYTKENYQEVQRYLSALGYSLPLVIGETGWKAIASNGEYERAHPVNQQMFYAGLQTWQASGTGPANTFWFEAFDEPWKGADNNWGLFNVSRKARYVIQDLYPSSDWEAGSYTASDALHYLPTVQNPAVTASPYVLYAQTVPTGAATPTETPGWSAWGSGTASAAQTSSTAPADGTASMAITPAPASWGWGMAMTYSNDADNLAAFANGYFNFSVKTTYPGLIQVGFLTGDVIDYSAYDELIPIGPGDYGYMNDGAWHNVQIPLSAMLPWGFMSSGMTSSTYSKLDLTMVTNPFVIADIYATTGKTSSSTTPIYVDDLFWSK